MRATLAPVDLETVASAIAGAGTAFPLATGGQVGGALICTPRDGGEPYAPDERELLQRVSQSIASALAATRARERAEFVAQVADGALDIDAATAKARELRAND
jgi:GAF domain-containing protein